MFFRDDTKLIADQARQKVLAACGDEFDAVITLDPTHVGYLSGYRSLQLDLSRRYKCAAIATRDRTFLIVGAWDGAPALEVIRDPACIYRYGNFFVYSRESSVDYDALPAAKPTLPEALGAAIKAAIRPQDSVGLDAANAWELNELKSMVPNLSRNVRADIMRARRTKTEEEIARIRNGVELMEKGLSKAFAQAAPGVTEVELSALITSEIVAGGGIPRFIVVTAGERSALADAYASKAKLKKGDIVRFDFGCSLDGYWTDWARTIVIGEPTHEQQSRYDALLAGELAQIDMIKPGIRASELFDVAVKTVREGALPNYERTHCGHGIGLEAHESPTLNTANSDVIIEEGMVLCVETPYYEIGWGGMMVEDMLVVRSDGPELLTKLSRDLLRC